MELNSEFKHSKFNNMRIIKEIGAGFMGRVYLAEYGHNKTQVVVKVSKFLPKLYKKPQNTWREFKFLNGFAVEHKKELKIYMMDHKLIDGTPIIKNKPYEHPLSEEKMMEFVKRGMKKKYITLHNQLRKSSLHLYSIYPLIQGKTLKYHMDKINAANMPTGRQLTQTQRKQIYGWFIDIMKQMKLLHENGYSHGDIHPGNTMITSDKKECTLIDYGGVNHKSWDSDSYKNNHNNDIAHVFYMMTITNHYDEHFRLNKKYGDKKYPIGHAEYMKELKKYLALPESRITMHICRNVPTSKKRHAAFQLGELLHPDTIRRLNGKYSDELNFKQIPLINTTDQILYIEHAFMPGGLEYIINHFDLQRESM